MAPEGAVLTTEIIVPPIRRRLTGVNRKHSTHGIGHPLLPVKRFQTAC